jgi:hypothetical protein
MPDMVFKKNFYNLKNRLFSFLKFSFLICWYVIENSSKCSDVNSNKRSGSGDRVFWISQVPVLYCMTETSLFHFALKTVSIR